MSGSRNERTSRNKRVATWLAPALFALVVCLRSSDVRGASTPAFAGPEGAGLVSLNGRDVPVEEAYERLSKVAGVNVRLELGVTNAGQRVSFSIVGEPFWVALQRLNAKTGMNIGKVVQDDGPAVTLFPATFVSSNRVLGSAVDGPFLATLSDATFVRGQEKTIEPTRRVESLLTLSVQADPRLKAMMFKDLKIDELIDESGRAINAAGANGNSKSSAFQDGGAGLVFRLPARVAPRQIGRMKLSGQVMVATRWETVEVGNIGSDEPSTSSAAGFRIATRARTSGDARHVTIELTRTGQTAPLWLKEPTRIILLKPRILDRRNRPLQSHLFDSDWFGKMFRIEVQAGPPTPGSNAPKPGEADHLRMEIPTDVKFYDVRFELRDLTLN
jgi:hypothetical protein